MKVMTWKGWFLNPVWIKWYTPPVFADTREVNPPYRWGHGLVIPVTEWWGVAFGRWELPDWHKDEMELMAHALFSKDLKWQKSLLDHDGKVRKICD